MGPNAGRKALTLRTLPGRDPHESPAGLLARADGFSLPWRIEAVVLDLSALAAGVVDHTTDTMARLLGRPATSLEQFVRAHRALFGG